MNAPNRLPVVELWIDGSGEWRRYFADKRLHQYRSIDNPHDFIVEEDCDAPMEDIIAEFEVDPMTPIKTEPPNYRTS